MSDYLTDFVQESEERITELNNALLTLERDPTNDDALENIFRVAHTLKGNCGAMGLEEGSDLAHAIEDLLDAVRRNELEVTSELMDVVFDAVDELEAMIDEVAATGEIETDPSATIARLRASLDDESTSSAFAIPSAGEIETVLERFDPPANDDHDAYFVRLDIAARENVNNGVLVVKALIDAFDLIGTDPPRAEIEAGDYGGQFDAVFGSAVGEAAITSGLEPVEEVDTFQLINVTEQFDRVASRQAADADGQALTDQPDPGMSSEEAQDLEVDELLDEFDEFDNLDEMVEDVDDDGLDAFDEMGEAGSFDELLDDEELEETEQPATVADDGDERQTAEAATDPSPDDEDVDESVDDASSVFNELKDEVEMVGFDELQDELSELEFDEFDNDDEVDMDELLGDDVDPEDDTFLGGTSDGKLAGDALEEAVDDVLVEESVDEDGRVDSAVSVDNETGDDETDDGTAVTDDEREQLETNVSTDIKPSDNDPTDIEPSESPAPSASESGTPFSDEQAEADSVEDQLDKLEETATVSSDPPVDERDESPLDTTSDSVAADSVVETNQETTGSDAIGDPDSHTPVTETNVESTDDSVVDSESAPDDAFDTSDEAVDESEGTDDDITEPVGDLEETGEDDEETGDDDGLPFEMGNAVSDESGADETPETDGAETPVASDDSEPDFEALESEASTGIDDTATESESTDDGQQSPFEVAVESGDGSNTEATEEIDEQPVGDSIVDPADRFADDGTDDADGVTDGVDVVTADAADLTDDDGENFETDDRLEDDAVDASTSSADPELVGDDELEVADETDDSDSVRASSETVDENSLNATEEASNSLESTGEDDDETGEDETPEVSDETSGETEFTSPPSVDDSATAEASVDDSSTVSFNEDRDSESDADDVGIDDSFGDEEDIDDPFADDSLENDPFTADDQTDDPFADDSFEDDPFADDSFAGDQFEESSSFEDGDAFSDDFGDEHERGASGFDAPSSSSTDAASTTSSADTATGNSSTAETGETVVKRVEEPVFEVPDLTIPDAGDRSDVGTETDEIQSVRVDVEQIDSLLTLVEGLVTSRVRLRHAVSESEEQASLETELDDLEDLTADLQETVMNVRLVPLQTVTNRLPRVVRDIAREQDKQVTFEMNGEDVELDRSILDRIGDPLIHLVRNAVDHGIEPSAVREEAEKPADGTVEVHAERKRDRVAITVEDDGSGLDPDRLRNEAVEAGVLSEEEARELPDDDVYELIFHAGLSTAEEVTDVSGRGVGMDVVERTIEDLDGTVDIDSEPGAGTSVTMTLPVSVAIDDILFLECGGEEFGIPTETVLDIEPATRLETRDDTTVLVDGNDEYDVVRLDETLETPREADDGHGMVVRIRTDVRPIAIHCDHVHGQQEVVVKPFEGFMSGLPGLSGATVRGRGEVVNILDVTTL